MKKRAWLLLGVAAMAAVPAMLLAQRPEYPITLVEPGKGPYTFPEGYQTPWDRIEIMVTIKMSPNLFVLHGSRGSRSGAPRRVRRQGHGALRTGWRPDGGYREQTGG